MIDAIVLGFGLVIGGGIAVMGLAFFGLVLWLVVCGLEWLAKQ